MRRPWRIRWWCTAAVASSAGIGMRSADRARSRQDQDVVVGQHRLGRLPAHLARAPPRGPPAPLAGGPGRCRSSRCGTRRRAASSIERIFARSSLVRIGCVDFEPLVRAGVVAEQVRARADHRDQAHHQLLADRVDRRVGDLGEVLLEVVVEQLAAGSTSTAIGVSVPIEPIGSSPLARHRLEEEAEVLLGVAERLLAIEQVVVVDSAAPRSSGSIRSRSSSLYCACVEPLVVGLGLGELGLDLLVLDDAALLEVDQQHLAGLQPPLADDASPPGSAARRLPRP